MIGNAAVKILRLREDGFIRLTARGDEQGVVALRDTLWQGGPLKINIHAKHATCAIYKFNTKGREAWLSHEDCEPFSGDSTCWIPKWRNGSTDNLEGKMVIIEVRLENGSLYSIGYEGLPLMNQEAGRYLRTGVVPTVSRGF
jgi:hypothetical protein